MLRERYARGEIDPDEFERRVDESLAIDPGVRTESPIDDELDRQLERR